MSHESDDDLPAGLPSKRSNSVVIGVASAVVSLPFLALVGFVVHQCGRTYLADTLVEIDVAGLDQPAERSLQLKAGAELLFAVSSGYSYSGNPVVMLDASLLRDGSEVATEACNMKGFTGVGASGSGSTTWYGDAGWTCTLNVPEGGASAIRVKVRRSGSGALDLHHTSVIVKQP